MTRQEPKLEKQEASMRIVIALVLPLVAALSTSGLMFTATLV